MTRFTHLESANILGITVHAVSRPCLRVLVRDAVTGRTRFTVGNLNMNALSLTRHNSKMQEFYRLTNICFADGMPIVAIARALGRPFTREDRITSLDFIGDIFSDAAECGWQIYYLGSSEMVVQKASETFRAQYPGLKLTVRNGYFDAGKNSQETQAIVSDINRVHPDILIVGMGMPRQEEWLTDNYEALNATVLFPIGALADYVAGAIPTPPRWAGRWALEWAFRLAAEPRRLGRRYLLEPWTLVVPLTLALFRHWRERLRSVLR